MSLSSDDEQRTPRDVLARVGELQAQRREIEAELMDLACEWAYAHPDPRIPGDRVPRHGQAAVSWLEATEPDDERDVDEDAFIPSMGWDAGAEFAAMLGMSTAAGESFIRDALVLRHRLPATARGVASGRVEWWRARRIAQAVLGQPADVAPVVDEQVAPVADKVGPVTLQRIVDTALTRLHAERCELEQLQALDARFVELDERSMNHTGVAHLHVRGDWADLKDFDTTVGRIAAILERRATAAGEYVEPLGARRSQAVGILADPETAARLLAGGADGPTGLGGRCAGDVDPPTAPRRSIELVVHLTPEHLAGHGDSVARLVVPGAGAGRPVSADQVRTWCGNPGARLSVRPVLDLAEHRHSGRYEVPATLRRQVGELAQGHCTFPWCERAAARCDVDHATPYDATPDQAGPPSTVVASPRGGSTCSCNTHPLCRRHHRLKTEAGWRVEPIEPGVWHWTSPSGHTYRRDPEGTVALTRSSDAPVRAVDPACWWQAPNTLRDTG